MPPRTRRCAICGGQGHYAVMCPNRGGSGGNGNNLSDIIYVNHETPAAWLGESFPERPSMNTLLSEGVVNTLQPQIDPDTGLRTMQTVRVNNSNFILATSSRSYPAGPLRDRFMTPDVPYQRRERMSFEEFSALYAQQPHIKN